MTERSNLHPEKRADKHGNVVTRWIRSFKRQEPAKPIPAPQVNQQEVHPPSTPVSEYDKYNQYVVQSSEDYYQNYDRYIDTPYIRREDVAEQIDKLQAAVTQAKLELFPKGLERPEERSNYDFDSEYDRRKYLDENLSFLIRFVPDTLDEVIASSKLGNKERLYWQKTLKSYRMAPEYKPSGDSSDFYRAKYREGLATIRFMRRMESESVVLEQDSRKVPISEYSRIVGSIVRRSTSGVETTDDVFEAVAVFAYIRGYHEEFMFLTQNISNTIFYDNREDIAYIADNLEDVYRVLPELSRRKITDRGLVRSLVEAPAAALSEGEL